MKINYYNTPQFSLDKRFNERQWQVGSDPRINRKVKRGFKIKFKYIIYVIFFIIITILGQYVDRGYLTPAKALQAPVSEVKAKSVEVVVPQNTTNLTGKELYKKMIMDKFGKDGENAWKIVSMCENRAVNPSQIGDDYPINGKHIVSVGLFQIRALPGRPSIEELKDVDTNINFAYSIFKRDGRFGATSGWYNCSRILGIK